MDSADENSNQNKRKGNVTQMTNYPLVSIIVPCYNCARTITKCVESIRNQSYKNIEIILVDDGSADMTPHVCDEYSSIDKRIITKHQKNSGLVCAWKAGVKIALGEYITFCDADDYIDSNLIERALSVAVDKAVEIVTFGIMAEYEDGSTLLLSNDLEEGEYSGGKYEEMKKQLLFSGKMQSQKVLNSRASKLIKKDIIISYMDDISNDLTIGEDAVTTYVTIVNSRKLYNIPGFYPYHYVRNHESMIGKYDSEWFDKMVNLREQFLYASSKYGRNDLYQIDNFFFSNVLMFAKKAITRNTKGVKQVIDELMHVRKNRIISDSLLNVDISRFSVASKIFAYLFIHKKMLLLYYITKCVTIFGVGKE